MESEAHFAKLDLARVPSPCYVLDRAKLEENLQKLAWLKAESGAKVLLALKAFSCFAVADLISNYLDGTAASGLYEARLGKTRFGGEMHAYAPGLKAAQIEEICGYSDHLIFNSLGQFQRFCNQLPGDGSTRFGLRVNPGHREVENPLYDPAAPWSRLGVPAEQLKPEDLEGLSGLHVHALCDHGFAPFQRLLGAVEERLGHLFPAVWTLNLGGGLLLTAEDYPLAEMAALLKDFRVRTGLEIILEPGTAVAYNAGALVCEVLDTFESAGPVAIVDASATCHMPDVIEARYTPDLLGAEALPRESQDAHAGEPGVWRIGGPTCLAGDVLGVYRLPKAPAPGDRLAFLDAGYYTMVKSTTFNGAPLPSIAVWDSRDDSLEIVTSFDYADFEGRLS